MIRDAKPRSLGKYRHKNPLGNPTSLSYNSPMTWTAQNPNFKYLSIQEKMQNLPEHLNYIIALADAKNLEVKKIWIYGSRARGNARENSDFDLAFDIGNSRYWSSFVTEIEDDPPSLYRYDLIDINTADKSLRKSIELEGVPIYERK
jgi:predicted nucleotidyltransferase